ncbi:MAG: hypothetical protein V9E99_07040 [Microthrixaceae bacterium]
MDDDLGIEEVLGSEAEGPHPEVVESADDPLRVLGVDHEPHVEVLRRPGVAVGGQRVAPDDQEADVTSGAALDELDEVVGQEAHHHTPG